MGVIKMTFYWGLAFGIVVSIVVVTMKGKK
jgi:hypothetical protein